MHNRAAGVTRSGEEERVHVGVAECECGGDVGGDQRGEDTQACVVFRADGVGIGGVDVGGVSCTVGIAAAVGVVAGLVGVLRLGRRPVIGHCGELLPGAVDLRQGRCRHAQAGRGIGHRGRRGEDLLDVVDLFSRVAAQAGRGEEQLPRGLVPVGPAQGGAGRIPRGEHLHDEPGAVLGQRHGAQGGAVEVDAQNLPQAVVGDRAVGVVATEPCAQRHGHMLGLGASDRALRESLGAGGGHLAPLPDGLLRREISHDDMVTAVHGGRRRVGGPVGALAGAGLVFRLRAPIDPGRAAGAQGAAQGGDAECRDDTATPRRYVPLTAWNAVIWPMTCLHRPLH